MTERTPKENSRPIDPERRQVLLGGAAIAASSLVSPALRAEAPGRMDSLWYTAVAADEWVQALALGNGRIGAMVFGGIANERLQLNEDTFFSGGPYDPVNPDARAALPKVRELVFAGKYAKAQALVDASVMARPLQQMSYQTCRRPAAHVSRYRECLELPARAALADRDRAHAVRRRRDAGDSHGVRFGG